MRKAIAVCALLLAAGANAAIPSSQRDALLAIYSSTGGASWTNRTGWGGAAGSECDWYGVGCDETGANVQVLDLSDNNLRGTLPSAVRSLSKLVLLNVGNNSLGGAIPPEIGDLPELDSLFLYGNDFTGAIPSALGNLAKLRYLDLGGNELQGGFPASFASLVSLEELHASNNRLTTLSPELARMPKLEVLELPGNQLAGGIPAALGDIASLHYLGLSYNQLTGGIPPELGKLRNLEELHLGVNKLTGPLPKALGDLTSLRSLSLAENQLSGTIPDEFFRLTNVVDLLLGQNQFEGTISPRFASLTKLEQLYLNDNKFTGPIPIELTTLSSLRYLLLPRNRLSGEIPRELSRLTNLEQLQLEGNELRGPIPRELASLQKLTRFSADENRLTGEIPPELGQIATLDTLSLSANQLTGTIPDSLRSLKRMWTFSVQGNDLGGSLPSWIGEWTELGAFFADGNEFTGPIPSGVSSLTKLAYFTVSDNFLTGGLPDFSRMTTLVNFGAAGNQLSGPIPPSIGSATNLNYLELGANRLNGALPRELGRLDKLEYVSLWNNQIEGAIPPEISGLKSAYAISLAQNRFTGTIPKEIGDLPALQYLDLSFNALRGPIPREITKLTALVDGSSAFDYNALYTTESDVRAFVTRKDGSGDWEVSQTIKPTNVRVTAVSDRSATLQWTPIEFSYFPGGYQVVASKSPGGPPASIATTSSKDVDSIVVRNLEPTTTYSFTVSTVTHPASQQDNLIVSDATAPVSATTTERVIAPPDVAVTESTNGLVQIGGVAANEDSFTLTNFGDRAAELSIAKDGDFFTLESDAVTIAAGASRTIKVRSVPQPAGTYYGAAYVIGEGAADGLYIPVVLLSVARPSGTVVAEAVDSRIEVAGAPGSEEVGTARFRNRGTAMLTGIVTSDQPWVVPAHETITISPGETVGVNFRIIRSRKSEAQGSQTATLSLVYVDGSALNAFDGNSSGITISTVTVVDVTKPPVSQAPFGVAPSGEVSWFVPGVASLLRGSFGSDLSILNGSSSRSIGDLRLYFALSSGPQSVATLQSLPSNQAVTLTNVVASVYNTTQGSGSLQVRSANGTDLAVLAKMSTLKSAGTFAGEMPVFRADRAVPSNEKIYLTGLRKTSDLVVQEVSGSGVRVAIELLDANGALVGAAREETLAGLALLELRDFAPANAVTAVVTNQPGSGGRIVAYARVTDDASGDTWSVVDWSRQNRFALAEPVRVPLAQRSASSSSPGGRRRTVRASAVAQSAATDVTLFNPTGAEVRATVQVISANGRTSDRDITLAPRQTTTLVNAVSTTDAATAHIVVTPVGRTSQVVVTARTRSGASGTAVPVVGAVDGLRVGQARSFAGLDDSTSATIAAASPATFTTAYGFVETAGETVKVRARLFLEKDRSIATGSVVRDFDLGPRQQVFLPEVVRSFAGTTRDTAYGDLHNLRLQIEVLEGKGAVVPFVVTTDNGSGDTLMRVQ